MSDKILEILKLREETSLTAKQIALKMDCSVSYVNMVTHIYKTMKNKEEHKTVDPLVTNTEYQQLNADLEKIADGIKLALKMNELLKLEPGQWRIDIPMEPLIKAQKKGWL
jgi:hypothetical protein